VTTHADIVAEARTWVGTPFKHQGRLKGIGADCGGLVLRVGQALGLLAYDVAPTYGRQPSGNDMRRICAELFEWRGAVWEPGDILLLAFTGEPQHVGIASDIGIIHVYAQVRRCVEHRLDAEWRARVRGVYAYRGLENG
jgi:cell wall-associated NlpC family hydrolase